MMKRNYMIGIGLSNFIGSMEFTISTHSMLGVVSLSPTAGSLISVYIGKDIVGQTVGSMYNYYASKKIDNNVSKFVNRSLIFQHTATIVETMTPLLSTSLFGYVSASANIMKNISFTQFGAVNSKVIYKLTENNNTGEIYTQLSIVNNISTSLGMGCGILISSLFPDPVSRSIIVAILSFLNICIYKHTLKQVNL